MWIPGAVLDLPWGLGDSIPGQKSDPTGKSWTNVLGGCKLTPQETNHPEALFIVDDIGVIYLLVYWTPQFIRYVDCDATVCVMLICEIM